MINTKQDNSRKIVSNQKKINNLFFFVIMALPSLIQAAELAELDCIVKPEMYVELSSPVNGILEKLNVDKGARIKKGQALAQIEASVEIAKVKLAELEAASYNEIKNRQVQLKFAKRNERRVSGLHKKNSVSQIEKDKAETEVALARIELKKEAEKRKIALLNLELAQARLDLKTIKSPIDGIVVEQYAMVGESVLDRAIMKLAQINPLRVELIAPTEYFGLIKKGMEVKISPERPANKKFVTVHLPPASVSY